MATRNVMGRRTFISTSAVALAATASSALAATGKVIIDVKAATSETFITLVGQKFSYGQSSSQLTLESVDVFACPNSRKRPRSIRQECFSLILSAPAGVKLPAGTYSLSNADVTPVKVYISKVAMPGHTAAPVSASPGLLSVVGQLTAGVVANVKPTAGKVYYEAAFS